MCGRGVFVRDYNGGRQELSLNLVKERMRKGAYEVERCPGAVKHRRTCRNGKHLLGNLCPTFSSPAHSSRFRLGY